MDLVFEIVFWISSLVMGFILGWFTNWHFYKKQRKENEASAEILKQLRQHVSAGIRLGDDLRGKIIERPDGSIAIERQINCTSNARIIASPSVQVEKREHEDET